MSRRSNLGVLTAVLALSGMFAASAGAAEWHTNGHAAFVSTNVGVARLAVHSGGSVVLFECSSPKVTGTLRGPTFPFSVVAGIGTVAPVFGGPCTFSGTPGWFMTCTPAALNALNHAGGTTFATVGGGVTTGNLTGIDCVMGAGATQCSTITGSINVHYINPATLNSSSPGLLTLTMAGQQLEATKIGAGCAALPTGTATLGRPGPGATVTHLTYIVDGPNAPWMFRTP